MSLVFAFDEELTGQNSGGKIYPRVGHAYKATITKVEESDKGPFINVFITGNGYETGEYESFSLNKNSPYVIEQVQKLANNVIASNDVMQGAKGQKNLDLSKWNGKGLQIGVVYGIKKEKNDAGVYVESKWSEPAYSIPVDDVDTFEPNMELYEAHRAKFWSDSGNTTQTATSTPQQVPTGAPVDDGMDLPF